MPKRSSDDHNESNAIIRRAIELDEIVPAERRIVLDERDLARIAADLEISPTALRSALVEAKAGVGTKRGVIDRLVGPKRISANRTTEADEETVRERVIEWLEVTHGLRPRVRTDGVVVAGKRRDLFGMVGKGVRRVQGLGGLANAAEIQVATVTTEGDDFSEGEPHGAVCLVADVGSKRAEAILGGSAIAAGGTVVVGLVALVTTPYLLVGVPVAAGVGAVTSRLVHRQTIRRVGESVEHTIDGVAIGEEPPRPLGSRRRKGRATS